MKQRVFSNGIACDWKYVNRGTSSGPHLFNIFINDLTMGDDFLVKYAGDSSVVVPVSKGQEDNSSHAVQEFLKWTDQNKTICNPKKCQKLFFRKKGNIEQYESLHNIPQCSELSILGITFQSNGRFNSHIRDELIKANKSLFVLRSLRKEGYSQDEIDYLFHALVMPNISYSLSVYGASKAELNNVQHFLVRCKKRRYISYHIEIKQLLNDQDRRISTKVRKLGNHLLCNILPKVMNTTYKLRGKHIPKPKVNTVRYKNCFKNRLIFKHGLAI